VFGLSFGELCLLVIVAIVVIGPKDMPRVLRQAGQFAARLRRMVVDVRAQSGIDEVLREGSLREDFAEIRKLAQADFLSPATRARPPTPVAAAIDAAPVEVTVYREREQPREGPDAYGATPDTAILYAAHVTYSPFATDPLYVTGDPLGVVPPRDVATAASTPTAASTSTSTSTAASTATASDVPTAPTEQGAPS
jgi:sec-independent protein translocase protein TatB